MTTTRLRSSYATLARPTAPVEDPVGAVRRRMGQRRQRRRGMAAVATLAVVAVVGIGIHVSTETPSARYRGGTGQTLVVRLPSPRAQVEDAPPTYGIDTRLLLSGPGSDGTRVARTCGLTRYYDAKTAAVWAKVFTR